MISQAPGKFNHCPTFGQTLFHVPFEESHLAIDDFGFIKDRACGVSCVWEMGMLGSYVKCNIL